MDRQLFLTVMPWLLPLLSVWLGWYLGERARRGQGDRAALGRALSALLLIRHKLARATRAKELLERIAAAKMPPEVDVSIKFLLQFLFPEPQVSTNEYNLAVSYVAGLDPLLAVRLRLDAMRVDLRDLIDTAPTSQMPREVLELVAEATDPTKLDETILELARLHSRKVLKDVQYYIREEEALEVPENVEDLLRRLKIPTPTAL